MNFADKTRAGLNPNKSKREMEVDTIGNWKKELSINDISNVIKETTCSMAEEHEDPSIMLLGLLITIEIVDKLFPKEEFDKYMASQEEKGDE